MRLAGAAVNSNFSVIGWRDGAPHLGCFNAVTPLERRRHADVPVSPVLILGCGYTGRRVAARLAAQGCSVTATVRDPSRTPAIAGVRLLPYDAGHQFPLSGDGWLVLHSVPVQDGPSDATSDILQAFGPQAARIVYLSTTGVYGRQKIVDENTPAAPDSPSSHLRLAAENLVLAGNRTGPWSGMVLRPAAIYGPGRARTSPSPPAASAS